MGQLPPACKHCDGLGVKIVPIGGHTVVCKACGGKGYPAEWEEQRLAHRIPLVRFNGVPLLPAMGETARGWLAPRVAALQAEVAAAQRAGIGEAAQRMMALPPPEFVDMSGAGVATDALCDEDVAGWED